MKLETAVNTEFTLYNSLRKLPLKEKDSGEVQIAQKSYAALVDVISLGPTIMLTAYTISKLMDLYNSF